MILILLAAAAGCRPEAGAGREDLEKIASTFHASGVEGAFVLFDGASADTLIYNPVRARERFLPASTFKILNTLVALETGVIEDSTTVLRWDGVQRNVASWNRDHDLRSAFHNSVVWYYQEVARRVGAERMARYVAAARYGNGDIGGPVDSFWLDGALRISAVEQVDLLRRLHEGDLPFSERTLEMVRAIMVIEDTDDYVLRAKTGWAQRMGGDTGWYVGYVERPDRAVYFALNMVIEEPEQAALRVTITREVLDTLDLIGR